MSLKCQYVKDIFPLYVEGDLSKDTQAAVEEHLQDCRDCKEVYQGERNFQDILKQEERKAPSPQLDNRIRLQVKYRKLRSVALVLGLLLIFSMFNSYSTSRNTLYHHALQMQQNVNTVRSMLYAGPESWDDAPYELLASVQKSLGDGMYRNANWLETRKLTPDSLVLSSAQFNAFMEMIEIRQAHDALSPQDELALEMMQGYFEDIGRGLKGFTSNYYRGIGSKIFTRPDFSLLAKANSQINELSLHYVLFNQFNAEMLTHEEAIETLTQTLGFTGYNLVFHGSRISLLSNLTYEYDLILDSTLIANVKVDPFTGQLISLSGSTLHAVQGEMKPLEDIEVELKAFLSTSIYTYEIEYLGINYNHEFYPPGPKLYSFQITPYWDDYEISNSLEITFDARTGNIQGIYRASFWDYNDLPLDLVVEENVAQDQALKDYDSGYTYLETVVVRSLLSGEHELVHVFRHDEYPRLYINARTGKEDIPREEMQGWRQFMQTYR